MPDLCVYALTAAGGGRVGLRGIAGEPLRAVRIGELEAIIGQVRSRPKPTDANLRKYDRLMTALWQRMPALLPARFGTTTRDLSELELLVGARHQVLRRNLRTVRGRAQMTVRVVDRRRGGGGASLPDRVGRSLSGPPGEPDSVVPAAQARWGAVARATASGAEYMRARAAEERRAREVPAFAPCRAAVQRWVRAERVEKSAGVATIYHLVPRGAVARYAALLQSAAADAGLRVIVSGPWPPYAFAGSW